MKVLSEVSHNGTENIGHPNRIRYPIACLRCAFIAFALCLSVVACESSPQSGPPSTIASQELQLSVTRRSLSYEFANLNLPFPAGVAAGRDIVFVGSPFEGRVVALSRVSGLPLGELPSPPNGLVLPFILKHVGEHRVAVLDAGGFPNPLPFAPVNPTIYEFEYSFSPRLGFSARLVRSISFVSVLIGFAEDIVHLDDDRYLLADALLGSIWIAESDGSIRPGIVPRSYSPKDAIAQMHFCSTMPLVHVGGLPFLFTASTLPGVAPLAVRDGIVYFHSSCAGGLFSVPLASLSDRRAPHERAADIRLISPKPANVAVEELLAAAFDPYLPNDPYLYAADALQLRLIRIDVRTGERQIVADDPQLFNFPSSIGFLPPIAANAGRTALLVVSNQQHRTPITNDAITQDMLELPFIATKVLVRSGR